MKYLHKSAKFLHKGQAFPLIILPKNMSSKNLIYIYIYIYIERERERDPEFHMLIVSSIHETFSHETNIKSWEINFV